MVMPAIDRPPPLTDGDPPQGLGLPMLQPNGSGYHFVIDVQDVQVGGGTNVRAVPEQADNTRRLFNALAEWWHEGTDGLSSLNQKAAHRAHRRIVEMGQRVVTYILEDLRDRGGHWEMTLAEITHESPPIPSGYPMNALGTKEAWLQWGRDRGLIH